MTLLFALVLLRLVLEDNNLPVLILRFDFRGNFGRLHVVSDLYAVPVRYHEHVEGNFGADFRVELLHLQNVAFGNLVLLVAVFDDCVHSFYLLLPVSQVA